MIAQSSLLPFGYFEEMELCPQCTNGYADHVESCPIHGGVLSEIRDLRPGMIVRSTYRIERKLGQGGMGAVYLAEQVFMEEAPGAEVPLQRVEPGRRLYKPF